jgi:hypothetical protein
MVAFIAARQNACNSLVNGVGAHSGATAKQLELETVLLLSHVNNNRRAMECL